MTPIHFVMSERPEFRGWNELNGSVHTEWHRFVRSEWAWLVQTFYEALNAGFTVTASQSPELGKINIMHTDDYLSFKSKAEYFVVVIVADRRVYFPGNCVIVQNLDQLFGRRAFWVPHWSQPGLKPRRNRSHKSSQTFNVAFAGIPKNTVDVERVLAEAPFERLVSFSVLSQEQWNDFSEVDALVAIRDFEGRTHREKPPTKLLNAWNAGVPFIGGIDSAYGQVGKPGINFLQVSSRDALVEAISKLQCEQVWVSLVDAGVVAAQRYSREQTLRRWIELFSGPIQEQYCAWQNRGVFMRKLQVVFGSLVFNMFRIKRRCLIMIGKY